jgi:alpha-ribazole phosphatase
VALACPAFRHPRPRGHEGRCIGQTDLGVDPRKARRLARRIRRLAGREGWPPVVCTSPLKRCRELGRCLKRWGWRHVVDARLLEMHFGTWEGKPWLEIPHAEVDAWVTDFAHHAPGGGECLVDVLTRARAWAPPVPGAVLVAHAGWMLARQWVSAHPNGDLPQASQWPKPPTYGQCLALL